LAYVVRFDTSSALCMGACRMEGIEAMFRKDRSICERELRETPRPGIEKLRNPNARMYSHHNMSALNKFVGKVAQQAAAEAAAKEAQLQRKNILLAGGLVAFGGYEFSLCVRFLMR
jgi:hypothetical protein